MSLIVIQAGLQDSFQDAGRIGYRHLGIPPGGAMDVHAWQTGNIILDNPIFEPALELHFPASSFLLEDGHWLAITGADFVPQLDDQPLRLGEPFWAPRGSRLSFHQPLSGQRCYLSVRGGWQLDHWLGSASTQLAVVRGGFQGRVLKKGDQLLSNTTSTAEASPFRSGRWYVPATSDPDGPLILALRDARHGELLTAKAKELVFASEFVISTQANRMGYRLQGPVLERMGSEELLSFAVDRGAIQLLPNGQLIVLMADHQVTGGYPVIGYLPRYEQYRLAQAGPGRAIRFFQPAPGEWEAQAQKAAHEIKTLQWICREKWKP